MPTYQDEKGKWYFRVYVDDIFGNRKQKQGSGFATKKEAQKAERELVMLGIVGECNMTFEELWNKYDEFIKLKQKSQSYRKTVSKVKNHLLPYFKDYKVKNINATVYTKWQSEIMKKGFKYKYNSSIHGAMVTILNHAIKFYGLKDNIASKVGNFAKGNELPTQFEIWDYEEYSQFIKVVDDDVYKIFFETLYYTGLRQGECLALTWNDLKKDYLDIFKTISKEKIDDKYITNSPKTPKSIRKVKLDNYLLQSLYKYKEECKNIVCFSDDWYIFGGIKPLAPSTIGRRLKKYCELAGVKKIRIHDFRHSHASLLLSSGVPITVISQRLGHSDINMTLNTYSHLIPNDVDKAINIIEEIKSK